MDAGIDAVEREQGGIEIEQLDRILTDVRLGVRDKAACSTFLFAEPLSSVVSAGASATPLFADFAGVGSEGARRSAGPRPPLKPDIQFSRIRLSQGFD